MSDSPAANSAIASGAAFGNASQMGAGGAPSDHMRLEGEAFYGGLFKDSEILGDKQLFGDENRKIAFGGRESKWKWLVKGMEFVKDVPGAFDSAEDASGGGGGDGDPFPTTSAAASGLGGTDMHDVETSSLGAFTASPTPSSGVPDRGMDEGHGM